MKLNLNPSTLLGEAIVYRTESDSRPGLFHYTVKLRHGGIVCSCEGWQNHGICKHVQKLPLDNQAALDIMSDWHHQDRRELKSMLQEPEE